MEIEELAVKSPEKIQTDHRSNYRVAFLQARKIALALGLKGLCEDCVRLMLNMYRCCLEKDCSLVEINRWWLPAPAGFWPWMPRSVSTTMRFTGTGNTRK
jgi:succinyl-CoA synthetase beta subunit